MPYIGNTAADRFVASKAASVYSGNGSTTAFTLEHAVGSDEDILVSVDGVIQEPSVAYAVSSGTTLTFTAAPSSNSGNNIFVYYLFRTVATVDHPATSALTATSGTFSAGVSGTTGTFSAGLDVVNASDSTQMVVRGRSSDNFGIITFKNNAGDTTKGQVKSDASSNLILRAGANNDALKIDTNGHITKPLQSAFLVQPASAQDNFGNDGNNDTVAFGTERFDQNSDFSSNTFTAPVTGKYQLSVNLYLTNIDSAAGYYQATLSTSNRNYFYAYDVSSSDQDPNRQTFQINVLADMDANDTAGVAILQVSGASQTDIAVESYFSGYLVC
jgi:hypothetical protein